MTTSGVNCNKIFPTYHNLCSHCHYSGCTLCSNTLVIVHVIIITQLTQRTGKELERLQSNLVMHLFDQTQELIAAFIELPYSWAFRWFADHLWLYYEVSISAQLNSNLPVFLPVARSNWAWPCQEFEWRRSLGVSGQQCSLVMVISVAF